MLFMTFASDSASFRVLGFDGDKKEIIVQPYVASAFGFRVVAGKIPATGSVLDNCTQSTEQERNGNEILDYVFLTCDGGLKLRLASVDLVH